MKFSIVVPIYKVEKYLRKCIESILNQTFSDFELILVEDGSPDNCPRICDEYANKDSRIKVIHKTNGGLVSARNEGIRNSSGKYIVYVDGDDWISNNLLQVVNDKVLSKYQPDMIVYSAYRQFDDYKKEIPYDIEEGFYDKKKLEKNIYPYMMYDPRKPFCNGLIFPVAWNKIFKRELLINHYCKDERIKMGEDNAFVFECLLEAQAVYFCKDILYFYNQLNIGSMTNNYDSERFENNKILTDYIESRIGNRNSIIDKQVNAFKTYWLIMAVFHEIKSGRSIIVASKHIKQKIKKTQVLKGIFFDGLPKSAIIYLLVLKFHLYKLALLMAKIVIKKRDKN